MTVGHREVKGEVEGERGEWHQLVLTKADGSHPQLLVEQFISDADAEACRLPEEELARRPRLDWRHTVRRWAGPNEPVWSPKGDKIAFLAALPFDPSGLPVLDQVEAWIYDLATKHVTRITHDDLCQHSLSWR
jgi:hypothetical protein